MLLLWWLERLYLKETFVRNNSGEFNKLQLGGELWRLCSTVCELWIPNKSHYQRLSVWWTNKSVMWWYTIAMLESRDRAKHIVGQWTIPLDRKLGKVEQIQELWSLSLLLTMFLSCIMWSQHPIERTVTSSRDSTWSFSTCRWGIPNISDQANRKKASASRSQCTSNVC